MYFTNKRGQLGKLDLDLQAPLHSIVAISKGKIGRIWDEGFDSKVGVDTSIVLVLNANPYTFCYIRLIVNPHLLVVGDRIGWFGSTVWWDSQAIGERVEIERIGPSFVTYDTMSRPMVSEWPES